MGDIITGAMTISGTILYKQNGFILSA